MAGAQDVNLKDYFKNFKEKLLVKMPKQEEADITSATRLLEVSYRTSNFGQKMAFFCDINYVFRSGAKWSKSNMHLLLRKKSSK